MKNRIFYFLILFCILSITIYSQYLPLRDYFTDDGLASSQVWSITEDRDGVLWIGCASGISRFNGFTFTNFRLREGLPSESITKIMASLEGKVVALTIKGMAYHIKGSKKFVPIENIGEISDFTITTQNGTNIFACVKKKGIYKFSFSIKKWEYMGYAEINPISIADIGGGKFILGSENGENFLINFKNNIIKKLEKTKPIKRIKKIGKGNLLLISEHNLYSLNLSENKIEKLFSTEKDGSIIFDALISENKTLWIASNKGLIKKDRRETNVYTSKNGIPGVRVLSTFQSSNGILWFGTNHGLIKLISQNMMVYKRLLEINPGSFICFFWDEKNNSMYVGTTAGVFIISDKKIEKFKNKLVNQFPIWDIERDRNGNFFFASEGGGLIEVKKSGETLRFTKENNSLPGNNVTDILIEDGKIYVACKSGFSIYNNGKWKKFDIKSGLPVSYVRCLERDKDGSILLGTLGAGILRYKNGKFTQIKNSNLKVAKSIFDILIYRNSIWAAANYGLCQFINGKLNFYSTESGILPYGLSVLYPVGKYLWIGSDGGAMLFDIKKKKVVKILTKDDGLPGNEFTTHNAILSDSHKNIWFGLFGGIAKIGNLGLGGRSNTVLNPNIILKEISFYQNDKFRIIRKFKSKHINLPYNAKEIHIKFEVVWYRNEYSLKINYKLEGINKRWNGIKNFKNMEIYYTSLPSGSHPLLLKVSSVYSNKEIIEKIATLIIPTPWWRDKRYVSLIILITFLFLIFINTSFTRWRTKKLEVERKRLNALVKERTLQLEKLNEELKEKNKTLKEMSEKDYLTNLYNRRYFMNSLKLLKNIHEREKIFNICFLMFDIDDFKKINDTYGHSVGDKVLMEVAKRMKKNVRKSDIIARYGGEEFLIAALKTDLENGIKIAEKIRKSIEKMEISINEGKKLKITISGGVNCINLVGKNDKEIEEAIDIADENLYTAKQHGKNKIVG